MSGARPAVLFDMDGLLIDSEPVWTIAEEQLAARLGGVWSADLKARIVGTRLDVAVPEILSWYDVAPTPAAVAEAGGWLLGRMVELYREELPLRPGAAALLDELTGAGFRLGLVSSSYRRLVDAVLATLGAARFEVTLAGDEVTHGKPHPEPYRIAAARLGVAPADCVVLEDAPSGVASAEAAGCLAIGVPDQAPISPRPDRPVVGSLTALDAARIVALWADWRSMTP